MFKRKGIPANGLLALRMMFKTSTSVTCAACGHELKGMNLQRMARLGCPDCGGKQLTFHNSEVTDDSRSLPAALQTS